MTNTKPDLLEIFTDMKRERRQQMEEAEVNFDDADILHVAFAALTAAGMVVVPREPSDLQDEAGHDAYHWFIKMTKQKQVQRRNLWQTIYRAMTEAANG